MSVSDQSYFVIGDVEIHPLIEKERWLAEPTEFFPQFADLRPSGAEWYLQPTFFDARSGMLVLAMQSFLVITPSKVILVDGCVGNDKSRRRAAFDQLGTDWLDQLRSTGVGPSDVSCVVFTHLHNDHVGWATRLVDGHWVPTFPRARHLVSEADYRYWSSDAGTAELNRTGNYIVDSVEPLIKARLVDFVPPDAVLDPSVRLVPAPGDTPGHVCVDIASAGSRAVLVGDIFHHPIQCALPTWSSRYSVDKIAVYRSRCRFLAIAAGRDVALIPTHFPRPTVGRITGEGSGYHFSYATDLVRPRCGSPPGRKAFDAGKS